MYAETPEMLALKDRAILRWLAELQADQPAKAKVAPGAGAAERAVFKQGVVGTAVGGCPLGDYKAALNPWMELRNRNCWTLPYRNRCCGAVALAGSAPTRSQPSTTSPVPLQSYDAETVGRRRDYAYQQRSISRK